MLQGKKSPIYMNFHLFISVDREFLAFCVGHNIESPFLMRLCFVLPGTHRIVVVVNCCFVEMISDCAQSSLFQMVMYMYCPYI